MTASTVSEADQRAELQRAAILLSAVTKAAGEARDRVKGQLAELMAPGDSARPQVEGLQAGSISYSVGARRVLVHDTVAFTAWVEEHYPAEVITTKTVRSSFAKLFIPSPDGSVVVGPGGEVSPDGLLVDVGNPTLSVRPTTEQAVIADLWREFRGEIGTMLLPGGNV